MTGNDRRSMAEIKKYNAENPIETPENSERSKRLMSPEVMQAAKEAHDRFLMVLNIKGDFDRLNPREKVAWASVIEPYIRINLFGGGEEQKKD